MESNLLVEYFKTLNSCSENHAYHEKCLCDYNLPDSDYDYHRRQVIKNFARVATLKGILNRAKIEYKVSYIVVERGDYCFMTNRYELAEK